MDPFGGFTFIRRRLPVSTLGCVDTASKLTRLVNMIFLEVVEANFAQWRQGAKRIASDQGVEKDVASAPFGGPDELQQALEDFLSKRLTVAGPGCQKLYFLMSALEMPDHLQICFNAVEEAIVSFPEWAPFERLLKAVAAARRHEKGKLSATTFKNVLARQEGRARVQRTARRLAMGTSRRSATQHQHG
eukprot:1996211-Pyramimonas_sp.AAC.1